LGAEVVGESQFLIWMGKGDVRMRIQAGASERSLLATLPFAVFFFAISFFAIAFLMSAPASATTYYVSSTLGSDANNGTSSAAPWQTVAKVNGQTFLPGDSVLFRRGDVWNESLAPGSSGNSGHPIAFDAYGTGAAPNLTGYYAIPASACCGMWMPDTGKPSISRVPRGSAPRCGVASNAR